MTIKTHCLIFVIGLAIQLVSFAGDNCDSSICTDRSGNPLTGLHCDNLKALQSANTELSNKINKDLHVPFDLEQLKDGKILLGNKFYFSTKDLLKDKDNIINSFDFQKLASQNERNNYVYTSKSAYLVNAPSEYFNKERLISPDFQKSFSIEGTQIINDPDDTRSGAIYKTKPGMKFLGIKFGDTHIHERQLSYDAKTREGNLNELGTDIVGAIVNSDKEIEKKNGLELQTASINYIQKDNKNQLRVDEKRIRGNIIVKKYYKTQDNKTLIISYNMAILNTNRLPATKGVIQNQIIDRSVEGEKNMVTKLREIFEK